MQLEYLLVGLDQRRLLATRTTCVRLVQHSSLTQIERRTIMTYIKPTVRSLGVASSAIQRHIGDKAVQNATDANPMATLESTGTCYDLDE
jgi:hypothetical protein